jgi:carboxymethylenebutenolidase
MAGQWTNVPTDGLPVPTYVADPSAQRPSPGVIVVQHAGGVDQFIRSVCDRLAESGYVAAAPNLFYRQSVADLEAIQAMPPGPERRAKLMAALDRLRDAEMEADVKAVLAYLRGRADVGQMPVGITGFCMGGRVCVAMATRHLGLAAAAPFYPTGLTQPWDGGPTLIERAGDISCPVAGFFGKDDQNPSPDQVAKLDGALAARGRRHEFHSYDGTAHLFMDPRGPAYREHAARDAWPKLVAFLEGTLKVGAPRGR